jgi:hypothetical protein
MPFSRVQSHDFVSSLFLFLGPLNLLIIDASPFCLRVCNSVRTMCQSLLDLAHQHLPPADLALTRMTPVVSLYLPPDCLPTVWWTLTTPPPLAAPTAFDFSPAPRTPDAAVTPPTSSAPSSNRRGLNRPLPPPALRPLFEDLFVFGGRVSNLDQVCSLLLFSLLLF